MNRSRVGEAGAYSAQPIRAGGLHDFAGSALCPTAPYGVDICWRRRWQAVTALGIIDRRGTKDRYRLRATMPNLPDAQTNVVS